MTANDVMIFITELPWWTWLGLFFVYLILFGDRKLWEYEAKFPLRQGIGRGEVELKCMKKKGTTIEVKLRLEESYRNSDVTILLNNTLIFTVPSAEITGDHTRVEEKIDIPEPTRGG